MIYSIQRYCIHDGRGIRTLSEPDMASIEPSTSPLTMMLSSLNDPMAIRITRELKDDSLDVESLKIATIFHDVGYAVQGDEGHAKESGSRF